MIFPEWVMVSVTMYECKKDGEAFFWITLLEELSTFWETNASKLQMPV